MTNYLPQLNMMSMGGFPMGMGGSGFSVSGMGNFLIGNLLGGCGNPFMSCNGEVNYDKMAGFAVGQTFLSCLFGLADQAIASHQAGENAKETAKQDLEKLIEKRDDTKTKLEAARSKKASAEAKVTEKENVKNSAASTLTIKQNAYKDNKHTFLINGTNIEYTYEELLIVYETFTQSEKDQFRAQYLLATRAKDEFEEAKSAKETADNEYNAAVTEEEKATNEFNSLERTLNTLNEQIEAKSKEVYDDLYNKADGSNRQRIDIDTLKGYFKNDTSADLKESLPNEQKFTENDLRTAIAQYRNATDVNERRLWANRIIKMWDRADDTARNNKNLKEGITQMKKFYNTTTVNS